jgi:TetR/AcrR family transcriptional repressor of nem operon
MTTKDKIIEYSIKLIKSKGYSSFSYDDIAQKFKISKAAIHHHFEKKEDLGTAVCKHLQSKIIEGYDKVLSRNENPWLFAETRINTIKSGEICPISSLQSDFEQFSPKLKKELKKTTDMEIEYFQKLVENYIPGLSEYSQAVNSYLALKGALQYRRILGEEFYKKSVMSIKKEFYAFLGEKESN